MKNVTTGWIQTKLSANRREAASFLFLMQICDLPFILFFRVSLLPEAGYWEGQGAVATVGRQESSVSPTEEPSMRKNLVWIQPYMRN